MSELMTVEAVVEATWQLQGYWTRTRFPLRLRNGTWSDVDVLAYKPEDQHLVICESKARGGKRDVFAFTSETDPRWTDILSFDGDNYFHFLEHLGLVCADGTIFNNFGGMTQHVTVQLVSNYFISADRKQEAISTVSNKVRSLLPPGTNFNVLLDTGLDVICRIIEAEREHPQGRRYGHPVLDLIREINRYLHADIKNAGRRRKSGQAVGIALQQTFLRALGLDPEVNAERSGA